MPLSKENYLHFVASLLIVLVLAIPFYTTSAYAAINQIAVRGGDGIDGFAKANDFLNFDVRASLSNETVTNDKVVLGSSIKFGTCVSITNGSDCTLRFPGNGTQPFEAKLIPFTINLFRGNGALDDSKQGNVTIDNKPPQVKLTVQQQKFSSQNNIMINYDVTDFACDDQSCASKCVGIKSIDFFTLNGNFKQTIEPGTSDCNVKSNISIEASAFNNGKNSVFARATDNFGQISPDTSVTFDVSVNPPGIISDSFAILLKGISLSTFSSNKVPVVVAVNISGDLNLNSVTADLSSLNPSSNLKNAKASCSAVENGISTCKWNIDLNPGQGGVKNIIINATDNSGNKAGITISKQMSLDDKGPVVLSLSTGAEKEGRPLVKASGNTVIAVFDEETGLSAEDVFLNVGSNKIKATSCGKEANWFCVWRNVNFAGAARVSVDPGSLDILGNDATGDISLDVTIDNKAPVLRSMNISPVGGLTQAFTGFFKIGDKIAVVANVTEDNDVAAVADFSKFISGASRVQGSCEKVQDDQNVCTWLTDSVNLQNSDVVTFNFSDNAGNTLIVTKSLKTFGLENAAVPDFWDSRVDCSPTSIDRSLGPLINQRMFCQVTLTPKSFTKPVSTVFISPATCSGGASIVESVDTLNNNAGSASPVLKITLKKDDFKINNAALQCSLNIFSKIGSSTTITKNPEIENVNINIQFFNLPLGELSDGVNKKIKEAKDDAAGILDIIDALNKIVYYAKKICQIYGTIYNIVALLYTITFSFKSVTDACTATILGIPFGVCAVLYNDGVKTCTTQQGARNAAQHGWNSANKFCAFVNCKITTLWGPTVQNAINNWLPGAQYFGPKTTTTDEGFGFKSVNTADSGKFQEVGRLQFGLPLSSYMNPQNNLVVATLFVCLPGIIYGLEKYRQIQCLYADCLQNAVGQEGLPVTACEDQKAFATCKYVTGELFAIIPYTEVLNHFLGLIKNTLSNPFALLGAGVSLLCLATCPAPPPASTTLYTVCEGAKLFATMGSVIGDIKDIIDNGFTIRTDYCDRLKTKKTTPASSVTTLTSSGSGATGTTK